MKDFIVIILFGLLLNFNSNAQDHSLRNMCENAHYATGYVKLHQYKVIVEWARISDHILVKLENIIYGENFQVLLEKDIDNNKKTIYHIKESGTADSYSYEHDLYSLLEITNNKVSCLYDL